MWTEEYLDKLLTTPTEALAEDMAKITGDIMVLGAGGKMGPSLCVLIKNACNLAGVDKKITAVSRFGDPFAVNLLKQHGIEIVSTDLLEPSAVANLPNAKNIIYMAGRKFGTHGQEHLTWAMNAWLPSLVAEKYKDSSIVVFSTGNVYPMNVPRDGGADETAKLGPIGEYAMSCLARERVFEYASHTYKTPICLFRLGYAVDLRYGVLYDIAKNIAAGEPVVITTPVFNCIWQGSANEIAIRCLTICESPANPLNVSGPETVSVKWAARELGKYLNKEPVIEVSAEDAANDRAYIFDTTKMASIFGYPSVSVKTLIQWQAEWLLSGGRVLDKPTHFEERGGKY